MLKYVRCICCKEIGHRIDECNRDPNLKTNISADAEDKRLKNIKDFKKLHGDTIVNTTHFIKKSVMVPVTIDDDGTQVGP